MLKRLTIRGFKSIRALEDFELRDLNVLIGANGAGKSNFICLFEMLSRLMGKRLGLFVQDRTDRTRCCSVAASERRGSRQGSSSEKTGTSSRSLPPVTD